MTTKTKLEFEAIYDTYSPLLYSIALEISTTQQLADDLLIKTFKKALEQNLNELKYPGLCLSLIKLIIQTALEQQNQNGGKTNIMLRQYERTPMVAQVICGQYILEKHSASTELDKEETRKKLRAEFSLLRNLQLKNESWFPTSKVEHSVNTDGN